MRSKGPQERDTGTETETGDGELEIETRRWGLETETERQDTWVGAVETLRQRQGDCKAEVWRPRDIKDSMWSSREEGHRDRDVEIPREERHRDRDVETQRCMVQAADPGGAEALAGTGTLG